MLRKKRKLLKSQKGFTLIELLAVIVILGIIAAIAVPAIGNIIRNSRIDAIKSDAIQVLNASKTYVAENGVPNSALGPNELGQYIDSEVQKLNTTDHPYSVTISTSGNTTTYKFSGQGTDGNITVTFTNASLTNINHAPKGDTRITSAD